MNGFILNTAYMGIRDYVIDQDNGTNEDSRLQYSLY